MGHFEEDKIERLSDSFKGISRRYMLLRELINRNNVKYANGQIKHLFIYGKKHMILLKMQMWSY